LQNKLSTPIISIKDEHRSGKFITPFTKIGGGNLILSAMMGVSGGGLTGELADSFCSSSWYRFAVMKSLLNFLFGLGCGELGLEESDRFLLLVLVVHSWLWEWLGESFSKIVSFVFLMVLSWRASCIALLELFLFLFLLFRSAM